MAAHRWAERDERARGLEESSGTLAFRQRAAVASLNIGVFALTTQPELVGFAHLPPRGPGAPPATQRPIPPSS